MNEVAPIRPDTASDISALPQPTWIEEIVSGLAVRSHFLLSGNIRDVHGVNVPAGLAFLDTEAAIWAALRSKGYHALLVLDPVVGLRLHDGCDERFEEVLDACGLAKGRTIETKGALADICRRVVSDPRLPIGLMIDSASAALRMDEDERNRLFTMLNQYARKIPEPRPDAAYACPDRNPVFWLLDRPGDLPTWFTARNPAVRELAIGLPDLATRLAFGRAAIERLDDYEAYDHTAREREVEGLALGADGVSLAEMRAIVDLADAEGFGLARLGDALRSFRIGTTRNPWTSGAMRARLRSAETLLAKRVKGQDRALNRTLDILVRSIMGLSAAQTSSRGNRPRGVLFFVGPTGVGKTELAKSVTEVLFGDETAMHRFDMSEFMNEASIGRLIGAPAGSPGHEEGGELINRVRARPFSVFLFDEIEKSHPRILDTFLQILDDGRLTDTRGETGYFSEALIIFTSNVGIVGGDKHTNSGQNVVPADTGEQLEEKLTHAVSNHFRYELKRPELMNRMGRNIVAFEFITPKNGVAIFDALLGRIIAAVEEEHGVEVSLTDEAREKLLELCTYDLADGGRGIGNHLETNFINPLARLLFKLEGEKRIRIAGFEVQGRETTLRLTGDDSDAPDVSDRDANADEDAAAGKDGAEPAKPDPSADAKKGDAEPAEASQPSPASAKQS